MSSLESDQLAWCNYGSPWPDWPCRIIDPSEAPQALEKSRTEGTILVHFFGRHGEFGWVKPSQLVPFHEHMDKKQISDPDQSFLEAVEQAETWTPNKKKNFKKYFKDKVPDSDGEDAKKPAPMVIDLVSPPPKSTSEASKAKISHRKRGTKPGKSLLFDDDIENSEEAHSHGGKEPSSSSASATTTTTNNNNKASSTAKSTSNSNSKRRKRAVYDSDNEDQEAEEDADDDYSEEPSSKSKQSKSKRAKTEPPAPAGLFSGKQSSSASSSSMPPASMPAKSGGSSSNSTQSKKKAKSSGSSKPSQQKQLEFRVVTPPQLTQSGKVTPSSSSAAQPAATTATAAKNGIATSSTAPARLAEDTQLPKPLSDETQKPAAAAAAAAAVGADEAIPPTQPWSDSLEIVEQPQSASASLLEMTPTRYTRRSAAKPTAAAAPTLANVPESPALRTPRVSGRKAKKLTEEAPPPLIDTNSLDIIAPTQPFVDSDDEDDDLDDDIAPEKQPFVPKSQMPTAPLDNLGTRTTRRTTATAMAAIPSPIPLIDTPKTDNRRKSSRLSQQQPHGETLDLEPTLPFIPDPSSSRKRPIGGAVGSDNEHEMGPTALDFGRRPAITPLELPPAAGGAKPTTAAAGPQGRSPRRAAGHNALLRLRQSYHPADDSQPQQPQAPQSPVRRVEAIQVQMPENYVTIDALKKLLAEEREKTMASIQELLDGTARRIETSISSKIETSLKKHGADVKNHIDEVKQYVRDSIRIEVQTAMAGSQPIQGPDTASSAKAQHMRAMVESLGGIEKIITAFKDSLQEKK